jgi:predicted TPR repeat methyltransferase
MKISAKNTPERNRKARILRDIRRADAVEEALIRKEKLRTHKIAGTQINYFIRGGIREYDYRLGVKLSKIIQRISRSKKGPVRVLDIGCGVGKTLTELKKQFGDNVFVAGLTLKRLKSHKELDHVYIRDFDRHTIKEKYDVIMSTNASSYFENFPNVLEKMFSSLNVGGIMLLTLEGQE